MSACCVATLFVHLFTYLWLFNDTNIYTSGEAREVHDEWKWNGTWNEAVVAKFDTILRGRTEKNEETHYESPYQDRDSNMGPSQHEAGVVKASTDSTNLERRIKISHCEPV
jgi:hypothetical protein